MNEELHALATARHLMRIAPEMDVPLTPRVTRLIDSAPLRRLARVSQLGLVAHVYPGAVHSRFEHSLGVYRYALQVLQRLATDPIFQNSIDARAADTFVAAALVHDIGHWPFCHPIEDMQLPGLPRHEELARRALEQPELAELIERDWTSIDEICQLLRGPHENQGTRLLASILSGPIDIDKMDYLMRDSLHAGVPYGRNFDVGRLISSLCVHPDKPQLAIGEKGRTAAEMMVFARYVMFSEVYWHHAVRAATAMLQRAVFLLRERLDLNAMVELDDPHWQAELTRAAAGSPAEPLVAGLFGAQRLLWKRVAEFDQLQHAPLHQQLARRPYQWLVACSEALTARMAKHCGIPLASGDVIIDAPPVKLEVDILMDVVARDGQVRALGAVSPVVDALAKRQFDNHVKRVRVFVRPEVRAALPQGRLDEAWLVDAVQDTEAQTA
ncbi:HD domain-containing protein [Roseimaritima ulvae]|uniref:Deoxyguanosinetriphosphate triphosphohydrolase-like protein n=1 Tax=Roseimaritima ulvae TaxID=980254 RepID=A0A5B9QPK6_9BACT|nr:HD domain-containing protein [Roseimaritima ulvae]QEG39842.1 Deoxyguanosinetriphosphate triphosphohydrolase-like protein [Roseimaritima ulvae]